MECEIICSPDMVRRGKTMLESMYRSSDLAGINCTISPHYRGRTKWLMTYGLGHLQRKIWTDGHLASGGRLIGWDLGYWDRDNYMRLAIDGDHPIVQASAPADRFDGQGFELRNTYDADGPIILVGLGKKSRAVLGYRGMSWEISKLKDIQHAYPARKILYRPKKPETIPSIESVNGDIRDAICGASLIVCKHSNVAVDACFDGIPVVCEDGAAKALYGNDLSNPVIPSAVQRLDFLRSCAWWQWNPTEAEQAWKFITTFD